MFRRIIAFIICVAFTTTNLHYSCAQGFALKDLPVPGRVVSQSPVFVPLTLKGLVLHPENSLKFDFIMDTGNSRLRGEPLTEEARKIMTYFLTALTMPEDDIWVNLSPYEKGRVIESSFAHTVMGRDLLAADYVLKQLTSSLIYPEDPLGRQFWKELYAKMGTSQEDIPVETINKVWIVPSEAVVWETNGGVMIVKSRLRVMLEEDYLALQNNISGVPQTQRALTSQMVRRIVLPVLEKQVNEGEHFAQLRQMYQAMILAAWYKRTLKESIINKVYVNQKKLRGVDNPSETDIETIYRQYLEAFKKGAFNYIKEDVDESSGKVIPRKYFSGGFTLKIGIVTLITALSIWSGQPTFAQQTDIDQALRPVGDTVLVQGFAAEADTQEPLLLAKATVQDRSGQSQEAGAVQGGIRDEVVRLIRQASATQNRTGLGPIISMGSPAVPILVDLLRNDGDAWARTSSAVLLGQIRDRSAVNGLIEALTRDQNSDVRYWSAWALGQIKDNRAVPALLSMLESSSVWEGRYYAATALGEIGDRSAIQGLLNSLKDQNPVIRRQSAQALGKIGASTAVAGLTEALRDDDPGVRSFSIEALGSIRDRQSVPALVPMLKDPYIRVRNAAVWVLGNIGDERALPGLLEALSDQNVRVRESAILALVQVGNRNASPQIIQALKDANPNVREYAARALSQIGTLDVLPALIEALKDENQVVRGSAAIALRNLTDNKPIEDVRLVFTNSPSSLHGLAEAMRDSDSTVRSTVINLLEKVNDPASVPDLISILNLADYSIRNSAAQLLTQIGQPAVASLLEASKNPNAMVRQAAVVILGYIGDRAASAGLQESLKDPSEWVRAAAADALGKIKDPSTVPALIEARRDSQPMVRSAALRALVQIGDLSAISGLIEELKSPAYLAQMNARDDLIKIGRPAIPALADVLLRDTDADVRRYVANIFAAIKDASSQSSLVQALNDKSAQVRQASLEALIQIGQPAFQGLIQALKNDDAEIRLGGVIALGNLRDRSAIPALQDVLGDQDPRVRQEALRVLNEMNANWWQKQTNTVQWLLILLSLGLVTLGAYRVIRSSKVLEDKSKVIDDLRKNNDVAGIERFLEYSNPDIRRKAMQSLNELLLEAEDRFRLGAAHIESPHADTRLWSIEMIVRSDRPGDVKRAQMIIRRLNDEVAAIREAARLALDKMVISAEMQYRLGFDYLDGLPENRAWALRMLARSGKEDALKMLSYRMQEQYTLLPQWLRDRVDETAALNIFRTHGSLSLILESGTESREDVKRRLEVRSPDSEDLGEVVIADVIRYRRDFTNYYLEDVLVASEFEKPLVVSTHSSRESSGVGMSPASESVTGPWSVESSSKRTLTEADFDSINPGVLQFANVAGNPLGGISLNSKLLDLQIKRNGEGVPLPMDQQPFERINIRGFVPQILNIRTVDLTDLLGLKPVESKQDLAKI